MKIFSLEWKERVGDGKLVIISITVSGINYHIRFYSSHRHHQSRVAGEARRVTPPRWPLRVALVHRSLSVIYCKGCLVTGPTTWYRDDPWTTWKSAEWFVLTITDNNVIRVKMLLSYAWFITEAMQVRGQRVSGILGIQEQSPWSYVTFVTVIMVKYIQEVLKMKKRTFWIHYSDATVEYKLNRNS